MNRDAKNERHADNPRQLVVEWWRLAIHLVVAIAAGLITVKIARTLLPADILAATTGRRSASGLLAVLVAVAASRLLDRFWPLFPRKPH